MKSVLILVLIISSPIYSMCDLEDGWKGIRVFSATRADVERKFGKPVDDDGELNYSTVDALIHVTYSDGSCSGGPVIGEYRVPKDTVASYRVFPKKTMKLSELDWNKSRFSRYVDTHVLGFVYYSNLSSGTRITAILEKDGTETVRSFSFEITKEMAEKQRCGKPGDSFQFQENKWMDN